MEASGKSGGGSDPAISFSVKELLARVDGKIDTVLVALSTKADKKDFEAMRERIVKLETADRARTTLSVYQRWLVSVVLVGLFGALATLTWLAVGAAGGGGHP